MQVKYLLETYEKQSKIRLIPFHIFRINFIQKNHLSRWVSHLASIILFCFTCGKINHKIGHSVGIMLLLAKQTNNQIIEFNESIVLTGRPFNVLSFYSFNHFFFAISIQRIISFRFYEMKVTTIELTIPFHFCFVYFVCRSMFNQRRLTTKSTVDYIWNHQFWRWLRQTK